MSESIPYELKREVPVTAEADVVVCGAGPGGFAAAVTAARNGADVVLIERYGFAGGMASVGEVTPFMCSHSHGLPLDRPLYGEWIDAMRRYLPGKVAPHAENRVENSSERMISKNLAMLAVEDLCLAAGVRMMYHHTLFDVRRTEERLTEVILSGKDGLSAVRGKVFVDGTGDGDLAALAGVPFEYGDEEGNCQPMTLCFKLSGVDRSRMPSRAEVNALYDRAKADGKIRCLRENVLMFEDLEPDVMHFNTTRVVLKSALNARELSEAEIDARRQLREYLAFLREYVPGFERAAVHSIAHHIGVRESRRIRGRRYLTVTAFDRAEKFPDAIARVSYDVDIHNPKGSGTMIRRLPPDDWYEIPYGCIVAEGCDNLLIGSRCISVDHALHSSMRVMPPVCSIGQAAGMAAAMAVTAGTMPTKLDGVAGREKLRAFGAYL